MNTAIEFFACVTLYSLGFVVTLEACGTSEGKIEKICILFVLYQLTLVKVTLQMAIKSSVAFSPGDFATGTVKPPLALAFPQTHCTCY